MSQLKHISFGGISLQIPEIWNTITESYTEPDGRECSMIEISSVEGDPRINHNQLWSYARRIRCSDGSRRNIRRDYW